MITCPFISTNSVSWKQCDSNCALNDDGCLLRKALLTYVNKNAPVKYEITDKDIRAISEWFQQSLKKEEEPLTMLPEDYVAPDPFRNGYGDLW